MKRKVTLLFVYTFMSVISFADELTTELPRFSKVRISPHINAVFIKGEKESIKIEYAGISSDEINYGVKGKILEIYLDDAKLADKTIKIAKDDWSQKESYYKDARITAYITYVGINSLELRGNEGAVFKDSLYAEDFKIRLYGESHVNIAFLDAETLNGKLYGENHLIIDSGKASSQKFSLYGENYIETKNLSSTSISAKYFGENRLYVAATTKISVLGFGEAELNYSGTANLKKISIGQLKVNKI